MNTHKPIPGYWYSNVAGQLLQVRALRYDKGRASLIVLEDIKGGREYISPATWPGMELILHSPVQAA